MDYWARDKPILSKEKHALAFSTIGNIVFLVNFYFIGKNVQQVTTTWNPTATLICVSEW